ncbi:MAG: hypothetical protein UU23_C0004G0037 [Candidatus Curtissbacteria bacterium GW2011_GWA1_40_9]|uniref:DUF2283 domain-containing protein n=1 Tax=Candidatus Curtissbacteria bacterium GW2011_GWA1_40_9 TaxID=1618408 RepID=A0A0G0W142_9BACT|nr:MAG: hypothetical protein UU23_C0004G0037 [Candidatus Curtissbacteria bacterium GW2011_GWA1_40_9]
MKVTYDPISDAMYIYFTSKKKSTRTEEVSEDFLVDYAGREMIGIEILDASRKLPKKNLESIKIGSNFANIPVTSH